MLRRRWKNTNTHTRTHTIGSVSECVCMCVCGFVWINKNSQLKKTFLLFCWRKKMSSNFHLFSFYSLFTFIFNSLFFNIKHKTRKKNCCGDSFGINSSNILYAHAHCSRGYHLPPPPPPTTTEPKSFGSTWLSGNLLCVCVWYLEFSPLHLLTPPTSWSRKWTLLLSFFLHFLHNFFHSIHFSLIFFSHTFFRSILFSLTISTF